MLNEFTDPALPGLTAKNEMTPENALQSAEFPPIGAGKRASLGEKTKRRHRASKDQPLGAGDNAKEDQKPNRREHHPTHASEGARDEATASPKPKMTEPRRTDPPQGDAVGQMDQDNHSWFADCNQSGRDAGDAHQTQREAHLTAERVHISPGDGGGTDQHTTDAQLRDVGSEVSAGDGGGGGQDGFDNQKGYATSQPSRRKAGKIDGDLTSCETQEAPETVDLRFTDPLVAEIVQLHRMRRRWMKAKNCLILQGKAFGRAVCDGDKDAGTAAFDRVAKGKTQDGDETLIFALAPFLAAIARFDEDIKPIEKRLEKLAKKLPIAPWVNTVTGLGFGSVAAIVGEAGDLSAYPSVSGVWKRMGLAVIDGDGRQRKVANAEAALVHGYNPERRSVVWVMADSMAKLQRTWLDKETGEVRKPAGVYGAILEAEKAKALEKGVSKVHAENRGKRHMSKAVLRDMTLAWRQAVGQVPMETLSARADRLQFLEAAE